VPAETRDIRTLSITDASSGRPITRLQFVVERIEAGGDL